MAPEQLEGQEADARTDIFAFGALVYELFTGQKAFEGKSQASLIGAIMHADPPPMSTRQPVTPPALERLVRTCLAKDPDDRWQSIRDVARELRSGRAGFGRIDVVAPVPRRARLLGVMLAAAVVAGGIIAVPLWRAESTGDRRATTDRRRSQCTGHVATGVDRDRPGRPHHRVCWRERRPGSTVDSAAEQRSTASASPEPRMRPIPSGRQTAARLRSRQEERSSVSISTPGRFDPSSAESTGCSGEAGAGTTPFSS